MRLVGHWHKRDLSRETRFPFGLKKTQKYGKSIYSLELDGQNFFLLRGNALWHWNDLFAFPVAKGVSAR